jgi:hypothetical protein
MTESELNKWKRTKVVGAAFQDTANNTRIFTTTTAGAIRFSKFKECSDYLMDFTDKPANSPPESTIETGVKILGYFENKYTCSGICNSSLFFYTLDLSFKIPN